MSDRTYYDTGAAGYDRGFGSVSSAFVPPLLSMARLGAGHHVLDVATGTGIAAHAAAEIVGSTGRVVASDISLPILHQARQRLGSNATLAITDGEALSFPDATFNAVLCAMGLMLFPNPLRGLQEFRRVLRDGGRAAVSVNTTPDRSFVTRISVAIGRHVPSKMPAASRFFSLGDASRLRALFEAAGFHDVQTATTTRRFAFPSFDAWFEPIDSGQGNVAVEFVSLPVPVRDAVRDEIRRELERPDESGGPIEVPVEILFGSGRK